MGLFHHRGPVALVLDPEVPEAQPPAAPGTPRGSKAGTPIPRKSETQDRVHSPDIHNSLSSVNLQGRPGSEALQVAPVHMNAPNSGLESEPALPGVLNLPPGGVSEGSEALALGEGPCLPASPQERKSWWVITFRLQVQTRSRSSSSRQELAVGMEATLSRPDDLLLQTQPVLGLQSDLHCLGPSPEDRAAPRE